MKNAIDRLVLNPQLIKNLGRVALVINQTSVTSNYQSTAEAILNSSKQTSGTKVTAVFGPQHGYFQTEQDNMKETPHGTFFFLDGSSVPLYSLYSETRCPTAEQLENVDTLIVDLQDIGCRVYTYMLTLAGCLRSAARFGKKVVVLDRNNPIGLCYLNSKDNNWERVEGNKLQSRFHSFVGWYEIPMRHGLSMGELGKYFIHIDKLDVEYEVIPVEGLSRKMSLQLGEHQRWSMPSPNIPNWQSAFLFPAFVCLEGGNVSEGRGTTLPFQLIGAPWLDVKQCIAFLKKYAYIFTPFSNEPEGLVFREHYFRPTFNKYAGEICHGIQFHIANPENVNLFNLGLAFLYFCCTFHSDCFKWSAPGYEYNFTDLPIHLILGNDDFTGKIFSSSLNDKARVEKFINLLKNLDKEAQNFIQESLPYFIYEKT